MDIQGLDYNTQREKLLMPEYGREIQKMVDYAIGLPTKEERLRCARSIVKLMLTKVPQIRDNANYEQTLWDHLYLMSDKRLDIGWPYDVSGAEKIHSKPKTIPLPQSRIRLRHYGRLMEELMEKVKTMPASEERDELVRQAAIQMKRDLLTWGHGSADDEKVAEDLARMTNGQIQIDPATFRFDKVTAIQADEGKRNRRKK